MTLRGLLPLALAGAALLAAGCGGRAVDSSSADANAGKSPLLPELRRLPHARRRGDDGERRAQLDDAFRASRTEEGGSFQESTIFDVTLDQMKLAASPMPRFDTGPQKLPEDELRTSPPTSPRSQEFRRSRRAARGHDRATGTSTPLDDAPRERVTLRPLGGGDRPRVVEILEEPEVARWFGTESAEESADEFISTPR